MNILVLGGTRYFGIPMIKELLAKGHDVTIAAGGNAVDMAIDNPIEYTRL